MNDNGDPWCLICDSCKHKAELADTNKEDLEIKPLHFPLNQWFDCNILLRSQMFETVLERQSLISFVETDGECIVSAGRDHEINVWNAVDGKHVRRLLGHSGPVTGLHLYSSKKASPTQRVIVSSSEDRSIRKWSLEEGGETNVFWTENVITCMGVMYNHDDYLAITGNSKGWVEVRHLSTGEICSTVLGHMDPVDVLVVDGDFACSATFDDLYSLKVWQIKCGHIPCLYCIDRTADTEFCSLAMCGTKIFLGGFDGQKLQVINFKTGEKEAILLGDEMFGYKVDHIRVWNNWIFSCSSGNECVHLDVHRMNDYQHFGTFTCDFNQACAVAAIESESSLKIVLGGSALAVLSFNFIPMQEEVKSNTGRLIDQETSNLVQKTKKSPYTMKKYSADEKHNELTDSDESGSSSEENAIGKPCERDILKSSPFVYSEVPEIKTDNSRTKISEFCDDKEESEKRDALPEGPVNRAMSSLFNPAALLSQQTVFDGASQYSEEPRMIIKRLEKILDEDNELGEIEEKAKNTERPKTCKEFIDDIMKKYSDTSDDDLPAETGTDISQMKESENYNVSTRAKEGAPNETKRVVRALAFNEINSSGEIFEDLKIPEVEKYKKTKSEKRKSFFNKCKTSKSNKNKTQKSGHKRCEIM